MKRMLTVAAGVLLAGGLALAGVTPSGATAVSPPSGSWADPNGNLGNTRDVAGSSITAANVSKLQEAWSYQVTGAAAEGVDGLGSFATSPVVTGGVVYIQDTFSDVYAISLATGQLIWEYQPDAPVNGPGPNGVAVYKGMVYGATLSTVFALSAATGQVIWSDPSLLNGGQGGFDIQPAVASGRVYLASNDGTGPGGGVLLALDAATGQKLWSFNTVVAGKLGEGVTSLGLGAGGAWETPLVNADGSVTFGTGNPYQSIAGAIKYPAADLYTDSEVNLDAATGKLRWYYQAVPNDFKDYDLQVSPVAATVGGKSVIITGGKMGAVYELRASSGALLWSRLVGLHSANGNDSALLLSGKLRNIKTPYTVEPGTLGGILTNLAVGNGSVYLTTIDSPMTAASTKAVAGVSGFTDSGPQKGEIEALSLATGKVEWYTKVPVMPFGAATVAGNLVFTTLYDGSLLALNSATGAIVLDEKLPTSTNSPIAVFGNTVLVPDGGPGAAGTDWGGDPQLVAYTVP